jgi:Fe-S cluster assembly iron-binding protein IscA
MFQVSEKASEMVKEHLKGKEDAPSIRIMVSGVG